MIKFCYDVGLNIEAIGMLVANTVGSTVKGGIYVITAPIDFALTTIGNGADYTARTLGTTIKKTTAGVVVVVGYPTAIVSTITAVSSAVFATGPCLAALNVPKLNTWAGSIQMFGSPTESAARYAEAALCPHSGWLCIASTITAITSYTLAKFALSAFTDRTPIVPPPIVPPPIAPLPAAPLPAAAPTRALTITTLATTALAIAAVAVAVVASGGHKSFFTSK